MKLEPQTLFLEVSSFESVLSPLKPFPFLSIAMTEDVNSLPCTHTLALHELSHYFI